MRTPVSAPQNAWFDTENVDDSDLTLEQDYNNQIQAGIINNHLGSGIIPGALVPNVLFNSINISGLVDGKAISVQNQPSDPNYGNQLSISLSNSLAAGNRTVKILIIGLDFENNLQYDALTFHTNETQVTANHYKTVLALFFNDFIGSQAQSLNLGGNIEIIEAPPFFMSRDSIMIAQDTQPNLFFRDFFVSTGGTLANLLAATLPSYNIDTLNITTGFTQLRSLVENDVSSQIGQKFLATTNNIQKITLLMSVGNTAQWTGDIIVSLYPLQTTVSCSTDIAPNLAIDFDPSNIPLSQLVFNYSSLQQAGIILTTVPQPVDFIFSNTAVGSGLLVSPNNYYAITVKRAGSADTGQIQLAVGSNSATNTFETLFNGSIWTDVPQEALWFQVWTDAAKVSDGQAYDNGHGMVIPKTILNPNTQTTQNYSLEHIPFVRNDLYYALAQAVIQESVPVQNDRTGNTVLSQKQFVPNITLLNQLALNNIQNVSNPLIIGTIQDDNVKSVNTQLLTYAFHEYGIVGNEIVIKVITDQTDGYRYDPNIIELVSEVVSNNLSSAIIFPNVANQNLSYKIVKSELITMIYGDVNGDGVVDENDLQAIIPLNGYNLNSMPTYNQYVTQTTFFTSATSVSWQVINPIGNIVIASGTDGIMTPNQLDGAMANFHSTSANFMSIMSIGNYNLVVSGQTINIGNNGTFTITALVDNNDITIQKQYYTSDKVLEIFRADIDGNMLINTNDGYLISNYVQVVPPFPNPTPPANKIGTTFQAIRLTVEKVVDRNDDYPSVVVNRATTIHPLPDIFLDGYQAFAGQNLTTTPLQFSISRRLDWQDYEIVVSSNARFVPAAFTTQSGYKLNTCSITGITDQSFPEPMPFDPGRNDFFVPNNLIMNFGGQFTTPDGYFYKVDFETSTIAFEIPTINFGGVKNVNLFTDFVANYSTTGYTRIGYPAMRFADCSFVGTNALVNNQIRFSVSVQSFSPLLNGIDPTCIEGVIVDPRMGVSIDYSTGILSLDFNNLYQSLVDPTKNTKIQITVFLKKAGWNNHPIFIDSYRTTNLLGIVPDGYDGYSVLCPDETISFVS